MALSRVAPWLLVVLVAVTFVLWETADVGSRDSGDHAARDEAFAQLAAVAGAHGHAIPDGTARYAQTGDAMIAYAPLDGITAYTDMDFATGVLIEAVVVTSAKPGAVPNGAYVVQVTIDPKTGAGTAVYFDADGSPRARVPARAVADDQQRATSVTSSHVWRDGHYAITCAGWQPYRAITY